MNEKTNFAEILNSNESPMMNACERYGIISGCNEECLVLRAGNCQNAESVKLYSICISKDDFIKKTRALLQEMVIEYQKSFSNRQLLDNELERASCDNCHGTRHTTSDTDEDIICYQDNDAGACFELTFDYDKFISWIEDNMMYDFELNNCNIIP